MYISLLVNRYTMTKYVCYVGRSKIMANKF